MMTADAVTRIADLAVAAAAHTITIDGVQHSTSPLHDPRKPDPMPGTLTVATLTGLVEYLAAEPDGPKLIHVESPHRVHLVSGLHGHFRQRAVYASAVCVDRTAAAPGFAFSKWLDAEEMIIALQALFEDAGQRGQLLKLLGTIKDEAVRTQSDDGVTQTVTARSGLHLVEETPVPNPVALAPFRTFPEVMQPVSPFVFRLRKGDRGGVQAALFEGDGGAWRWDAVARIVEWLDPQEGVALPVIG